MITIDYQCLPIQRHSRILDIGCGSGRHTAAAFDLRKGSVIGADPNFKDLQAACERVKLHARWNPRKKWCWSLAAADMTRLPFKKGSFDIVICSEVLEHIAAHRNAIRECSRVLKPGGHLAVSVPRRWPETICWALSSGYRNTAGGHVRIYVTQELIGLIESDGLIHWRTSYAHSLHAPYWWLKCLLGVHRPHLWPVAVYQRFLTWDMMAKPRFTRLLERMLNPLMGKSVVLYFRKKM